MEGSALAEYVAQIAEDPSPFNLRYPMYVVPLEVILDMETRDIRPHQALLRDGVLVRFNETLGKAMFVSHQWLSNTHPDPQGKQLKVFQQAMRNLLSGSIQVSPDFATEAADGQAIARFSEAGLKTHSIFVWYDYFCVPQMSKSSEVWSDDFCVPQWSEVSKSLSQNPFPDQRDAIASIPAYISRCEFFVALCPIVKHVDTLATLSYYAWTKRGWCSTEKMVGQLAGCCGGKILLIESPKHMSLAGVHDALYCSAGDGELTVKEDLGFIVSILQSMLEIKLRSLLKQGDLHCYRFFLNHQHSLFRNCDATPLPGVLPDLPCQEEKSEKSPGILEAFLFQNGFRSALDEDDVGWSPLCYAVVGGESSVVKSLLAKAADPNFIIRKRTKSANLPSCSSVLSLCVRFGDSTTLELLLQARADPKQRDGNRNSVLSLVAFTDDVEKARLLLEARADPCARNKFNINPLQFACNAGATNVVRELLKTAALRASPYLLSYAVMFLRGGAPENVAALLQAQCNVNEQYTPPTFGSRLFWSYHTARYRLHGASTLTTIAYHHHNATPLMLSILSGRFAAAQLLLEAGARVDLRNSRKKTAFDFAVLKSAPESLLQELWCRDAGSHAAPASLKWWQEHIPEAQPADGIISMNSKDSHSDYPGIISMNSEDSDSDDPRDFDSFSI